MATKVIKLRLKLPISGGVSFINKIATVEIMENVRLDKWLWASRFFKTRKDAVEAINGGKVHLNGTRVKPSRNVQIKDRLNITRNNEKYVVTVEGINDKRRPAKEAQLLYTEDKQSIEARESEREIRRINNASVAMPSKRPNKKQRRQMDRFKKY